MTETIKAGLSGGGFIGEAHIEALRRFGVKVAGIAEADAALAREKADQLGIEKSYGCFEEMAHDPQIDSVHITSPNYLHYEQAKQALLCGKHVVCEKPLTLTSAQSAELIELAAQKNLVGAVSHNIRFYPLVQQARAMVQEGQLGHIFIIQGSYLQDWLLLDTDWSWA